MGFCLEVTCKPEFWSDPSKEFERKAKHHKTSLKLLVCVPSLLRARPLSYSVSWFLLGP